MTRPPDADGVETIPSEPIYSDWDDYWAAHHPEVLDLLEQVLSTVGTTRLPRIQLTVSADETNNARPPRTATFTIEPNGPDRGHDRLTARLPVLLRSQLPVEFVGTVQIDLVAKPGPRASGSWSVDVGTRRRYDDPSIRKFEGYLIQREREQDARMADMFNASASVIRAGALAMQASTSAAGPVPPVQPSPLESIARYAVDQMTEAYERGRTHPAPETPPDPCVEVADPEAYEDVGQQAPFDAWAAVLGTPAEQTSETTNGQDSGAIGYGPFDDHGLVESDIIEEPLDVTPPRSALRR